MAISARSYTTKSANSFETGVHLARQIRAGFADERLAGLIAYSTVCHDQRAFLAGIREISGPGVPVAGCSAQGVMGPATVAEEGYVAGLMGLGGQSLHFTTEHAVEFGVDSVAKATAMGRALCAGARGPLRVVIVHYDPLCGADIEVFLRALHDVVRCTIVGGAAAEFWGPMERTFQYTGDRALRHAMVAVGLSGAFTCETDICDGTSPVGIEMTVTRAQDNEVFEFDGRPALDVWTELCSVAPEQIEHSGAIGVGLPTADPAICLVRCAFGVDEERKGVRFQAAIPVGARLTFNHRTIRAALEGSRAMGGRLATRLKDHKIRAILGFECGARTKPFLGKEATLNENRNLQNALAPDAAWLGMLAWGEISMFDGRPGFVNFSFPLLALAD